MMRRHLHSTRQRGAALVIGLIVLLMLTLLGVSNMNMTSLELKITSNTQNHDQAFQGAASAIELVMQAPPNSPYYISPISKADQVFNTGTIGSVQTTATVSYVEAAGDFMCVGESSKKSCNIYKIRATGTHLPSGATSVQELGFYRPGLKSGG